MLLGQEKSTGATPKQMEYIRLRTEHPEMAKNKAVQLAGYAPGTSCSIVDNSKAVANKLVEAYREMGLNEEVMARKAKDLLEAKNLHFFTLRGKVTDERSVPDNITQLRALDLVADTMGYKKTGLESINIGLIQVPQGIDAGEWNEDPGDEGARGEVGCDSGAQGQEGVGVESK